MFDLLLRTTFVPGSATNASGWTEPSSTFNYTARAFHPVPAVAFQGSPLKPSYLPNSSWSFDIPSGVTPAGSTPFSPSSFLNSEDYHFLEDSVKLYLRPATTNMQDIYVKGTKSALDDYLNLIGFFIPTAVTLIVLYIVLRWLPDTSAENKSIMSKRAMLLYLPAPVVHNMPALKEMITLIIARDGDEHVSKGARSSKVIPS